MQPYSRSAFKQLAVKPTPPAAIQDHSHSGSLAFRALNLLNDTDNAVDEKHVTDAVAAIGHAPEGTTAHGWSSSRVGLLMHRLAERGHFFALDLLSEMGWANLAAQSQTGCQIAHILALSDEGATCLKRLTASGTRFFANPNADSPLLACLARDNSELASWLLLRLNKEVPPGAARHDTLGRFVYSALALGDDSSTKKK